MGTMYTKRATSISNIDMVIHNVLRDRTIRSKSITHLNKQDK
jgi:hypothetical protein